MKHSFIFEINTRLVTSSKKTDYTRMSLLGLRWSGYRHYTAFYREFKKWTFCCSFVRSGFLLINALNPRNDFRNPCFPLSFLLFFFLTEKQLLYFDIFSSLIEIVHEIYNNVVCPTSTASDHHALSGQSIC